MVISLHEVITDFVEIQLVGQLLVDACSIATWFKRSCDIVLRRNVLSLRSVEKLRSAVQVVNITYSFNKEIDLPQFKQHYSNDRNNRNGNVTAQ